MCDTYRSSSFNRGVAVRFGGPSCRRFAYRVRRQGQITGHRLDLFAVRTAAKANGLPGLHANHPLGRSSRGTVSLPVPSGGRPALRAQGYIFRAPSEVQISAAVSTCSHSVVRPQLRAGRNRRAISLPVGLGPTSVDRASRHPMGQPTPASAGEHRCPESYAVVPYVNALRVEFDERHPIESGYREGRVATECDIFYRAIVLKHVSGSGHRCC